MSAHERSEGAATPAPDLDAIRGTWRWLAHAPHGVSELRVIRPGGPLVGLGFFDDEEAFVAACARENGRGNVYVGVQPRPRRLLAMSPNRLHGTRNGAKRDDVEIVTATVLDLDPARARDTASTDAELAAALDLARRVSDACVDDGLVRPRLVMSGNGAQLWFAVQPIVVDETNRARVQAGLRAFETSIRERFCDARVHVDSVHDLPRIIKVTGTVSRKGVPTADRPHRESVVVEEEDRLEDAALRELILAGGAKPSIARTARRSLPVVSAASAPAGAATSATDGMCTPVQRLFADGQPDRSVAIFNVIRWLAHKGEALAEITTRVVAWDAEHGGKLAGRDAAAYVANAYAKIRATADADGSIAPPCKSLQRAGYCPVNNDPAARCELKSFSLDAWKAGAAKPVAPSSRSTSLKGAVFVHEGCYCVANGDGVVEAVSSFVLAPTMRVMSDQGEAVVVDARPINGGIVRDIAFPLSAFSSRRDFVRHLPSADLQWTGTDGNVQGVLRLLSGVPTASRRGSTRLGVHDVDGRSIWLLPDGALDASGTIADPPLAHVPSGCTIDRRVRFASCTDGAFRAVAKVVFEQLWRVNTPEAALPVLGWFFASPLKPALMRLVGSFPTLFVWGSQGSGKTCLVTDVFWPLFGVPDSEPFSATETEFALVKLLSSTASIPLFIDEYKPFDMPKHRLGALHRLIRRLYRGETEERGRIDQHVNEYQLSAPLCVAGETRPSEAAILERLLTANPSKTSIDAHPEHRAAFRALRAAPLHLFARRYVSFCLGRDVAADLGAARATAARILDRRTIPGRVAENVTTMLLGVRLFEEFGRTLGFALPADLGARRAVDAVLSDVLEQEHGVKNALDAFVEMLGVMAIQGDLIVRKHYRIDAQRLSLHLESAYDAFRAHCMRINYEGEMVDLRALRRLVQENHAQGGYVAETSDRACFDGRVTRRRVTVLDLAKTGLVSADDFAQEGAT